MVANDPSSKYYISANYDFGKYYNGHLNYLEIETRFAPIPHVNLGATFQQSQFKQLGDLQTDKRINLLILESRFALNPRIQLIGFYQKNTTDNLNALNLRFSWEYQPLSYIYVVFNQLNYTGDALSKQHEQTFLTKLSFLKQF